MKNPAFIQLLKNIKRFNINGKAKGMVNATPLHSLNHDNNTVKLWFNLRLISLTENAMQPGVLNINGDGHSKQLE